MTETARVVRLFEHDWEIATGIPIPRIRREKRERVWGRQRFPFQALSVGESFDVWPDDGDDNDVERCQNRVSGAFCTYRAKLAARGQERNYTTRQIHVGNGAFVRCWRVL